MRLKWCLFLFLVAADTPTPSSVDKLAAAISTWVADDEPVAIHVSGRTPAVARLVPLVSELIAERTEAVPIATPGEARAKGFAHFVDIELAVDATDLRAFGRVVRVGRDLWAEIAGRPEAGTIGTFVVGEKLDGELRAYLGAPPPLVVPPKPRKLAFRAIAAGTLELGAPLLDLAAGDLDGDGKAELVALTTDEVVVFAITADGARELARAVLDGPPPVPRPRAPVGAVLVDGGKISARSSDHAAGATFTFSAGALQRGEARPGYPLCTGTPTLFAATHLFATTPRALAVRCGAGVVASVDAEGVLRVARPDARTVMAQISGVGTAFVLADLDGDGQPELVAAGAHAPGAPDAVSAFAISDGGARLLRKSQPTEGGIAGIAAGDFDGDGSLDLVALSRASGTQVSLWRFD